MDKNTFRFIDLAIFTLISAGIEAINIWAFQQFPLEGFALSFVIVMGLIAMFRWNIYGLVVPVVSGVVTILVSGQRSTGFYLAYTLGYLFMAVALIWFKYFDKQKMRSDPGLMIGYYLTGFFAAELGRAIGYIPDGHFGETLYLCFVLDLLNLVISGIVFFLACKQKKLVYDMNQYLLDLAEDKKIPESALMREANEDYLALESLAESNQVSECALLDGGMLTEEDLQTLQKNYNEFTGTTGKYDKNAKEAKK